MNPEELEHYKQVFKDGVKLQPDAEAKVVNYAGTYEPPPKQDDSLAEWLKEHLCENHGLTGCKDCLDKAL